MQITRSYLNHNRPGTKRTKTTAIAIHWVGNPGSSAMANRNYFNTTERAVSSNYIVGLSGEIICCIPDEEISWCTNQANSYTVSIENCHPDATGKFNDATYNSLVELTANLCRKYGLNPQKGGVIRHFDVTGKICPKWFVPKKQGGTDTDSAANWLKFQADIAARMGSRTSSSSSTEADTGSTYLVKITASALNIRAGAGTSYKITGCIRDKGTYTIVQTSGNWGKLKSGAGWICLNYTKQV